MAYKYNPLEFTNVQVLRAKNIDESELRKAYSYFRKIALKRLKNLGKSEYAHSDIYLTNKDKFETLRVIRNKTELIYNLRDVSIFLANKSSSVKGMRRIENEKIKTMREHGYNFRTKQEYRDFWEFMNEAREMAESLSKIDSDVVVELYYNLSRRGLDKDEILKDFDYYKENKSVLKHIRRPVEISRGQYNSEMLKKQIEQYKAKRK